MNSRMRNEQLIAIRWRVLDFGVNSMGNLAVLANLLTRSTSSKNFANILLCPRLLFIFLHSRLLRNLKAFVSKVGQTARMRFKSNVQLQDTYEDLLHYANLPSLYDTAGFKRL